MKYRYVSIIVLTLLLVTSCQTTKESIAIDSTQQAPIRSQPIDVLTTYITPQAITPQAVEIEAGNLFDNGGFEAGLTGWEACEVGAILPSSDANTGTGALAVVSNNCFYRSVEVQAAQELVLSCYAKLTSGNGWTGMGLAFSDASWREVSQAPVALITGRGFKRHDVRATVPTNGKYVSMWFYSENPAVVDDCSLMLQAEPPPPPPPSGENLLENASFENLSSTEALNDWTTGCGGNWQQVEVGRTGKGLKANNGICIDQALDAGDVQTLQGQSYSYSCYVKNSNGYASISIFFDEVPVSTVIPLSLEFQKVEVTGSAPSPKGSGFVSIYAEGNIVVDDCELKATSDLDIVVFPDRVLAREVRRELGLALDAPITKEKLLELTSITYNGDNFGESNRINSLKGLEFATNLVDVDFTGNTLIEDANLLGTLPSLKVLNLTRTNVDINSLSGFNVLEKLLLGFSPTTEIGQLSGFDSLTELDLFRSQLTDISGIASLTLLTKLNLGWNDISDISSLSNLTNLKDLFIFRNNISNVAPLANLTNLEILNMSSTLLEDISAIEGLINLREFSLTLGRVADDDIPIIGKLINLERLRLDGNNITNIGELNNLINLVEFSIGSNQISNISAVENMTKLVVLNLQANRISDIQPLTNLVNIEELALSANDIIDLVPLQNLEKIKNLGLFANLITDISPLIRNQGIGQGDFVGFSCYFNRPNQNIIDADSIQALVNKGVTVSYNNNCS